MIKNIIILLSIYLSTFSLANAEVSAPGSSKDCKVNKEYDNGSKVISIDGASFLAMTTDQVKSYLNLTQLVETYKTELKASDDLLLKAKELIYNQQIIIEQQKALIKKYQDLYEKK